MNHAPEKFKSLQNAKRPRIWESLEDTCKKMREDIQENTLEEVKHDIEVEEWYEVSDDRFDHECEKEQDREQRLQEKDMQKVIPQSRFNKIVFVESQVNLTQILSQDVQESTETPNEKYKFLTQLTPLTSKIIESFDFTTYLYQSQTLTPTFKQLNEDSREVPSTVSPDTKPPSDSFPTLSSFLSVSRASSPLNFAKTSFLLKSRSIEKLLSNYLRCMQIPFKITFHTDTLDITACKIFLNGNLGSSAKHSSKRQAQRLACARCMKIMNRNLLLTWALSKRT